MKNYIFKSRTILPIKFSSIFFIFFSSLLNAQLGFEEHLIFSNPGITHRPQELVLLDLDNDGDQDIVFASRTDDQISWYENLDGLGNYSDAKKISTTTSGIWDLFSGDIDNDGDIDIVVERIRVSQTNNYTRQMVWFENLDGQGNFSDEIIIVSNLGTRPKFLFDLDEDGDLDILFGLGSEEFGWVQNVDGTGNFSEGELLENTEYDYAKYWRNIHLGDIDGDGDIDVVSADGRDLLITKNINNAIGYSVADTLAGGILYTSVQIVDIDGDGDNDILATSSSENGLHWFENLDGIGDFSELIQIEEPISDYSTLDFVDLDNDNLPDIITSGYSEIEWRKNLSNGQFSETKLLTDQEKDIRKVLVFDFDLDGDMDLVSASNIISRIRLYENNEGFGEFSFKKELSKEILGLRSLFVSDLDGDGDKDLISSFESTNQLVWIENINEQNIFSDPIVIDVLDEHVNVLTAFDVDLDGDQDIVYNPNEISSSGQDGNIYWIENLDGKTSWGTPNLIFDGARDVNKLVGVDLDMDGDKDLIVSDHNTNKIRWFENTNGKGLYSPENVLPSNYSNIFDIIAFDYDGDSDIDIISGSRSDTRIYLNRNLDSLGTFGEKETILDFNRTNFSKIDVADVEGDGDLDLLLTTIGYVTIYERNELTNSYQKQDELFLRGTDHSQFVDLDLDGDLDITFSSSETDSLYWYENINGIGDFVLREVPFHTVSPQDLLINDLNNDGMPDLLTYTSNDRILWYENTGLNLNKIIGEVLLSDMNGSCENSAISVENFMITTKGENKSISTLSRKDNYYNLYVDKGSFKTEITNEIPYFLSSIPGSFEHEFSDIGSIDTASFCLEVTEIVEDLVVTIIPLNELRPGFFCNYRVLIENKGIGIHSGEVKFAFDGNKQGFVSASPIPSSQELNLLKFDFVDLKPFESSSYDIKLKTELLPIVMLGEILTYTAFTDEPVGDILPENNIFDLEQLIIGSYDPNDIRVFEGEEVHIDNVSDYLHYVIRFQNTGTASAINVNVTNSVDKQLDWRTFELLSYSHPVELIVIDSTEFNFYFDDINLPDSLSNESESHGFICYKIKPIEITTVGDVAYNQAKIFFDFNPPIITNEVATKFVNVSSLNSVLDKDIALYPNPVQSLLFVPEDFNFDKIEIYDFDGKLKLQGVKVDELYMGDLSPGLYFCRLSLSGRTVLNQIVVKL